MTKNDLCQLVVKALQANGGAPESLLSANTSGNIMKMTCDNLGISSLWKLIKAGGKI